MYLLKQASLSNCLLFNSLAYLLILQSMLLRIMNEKNQAIDASFMFCIHIILPM